MMNESAIWIFFVLLISFIRTKCSTLQPEINGANAALMYLSRFGYINPSAMNHEVGSLLAAEAVREAILDFQAFAGLNQTGTLDEETVNMMNTPRCGVVDRVGYGSQARKKRYALQGSRWKVKQLKYKVTKYPKTLRPAAVDKDVDKAFQIWAEVTDLTFTAASSGKVHIEIRFERTEHGDGDPFDGRGGTLAHAYFPIYGGDAHFDDAETWTVDSYSGTNLFQVAAHEFGHSLGLSHSDVRESLMAPFYRGYQEEFTLHSDDISAIQALYGEKETEKPGWKKPSSPNKPSTSDSTLCKDGSVDAIVTVTQGTTYVFKGDYYYKLDDDGIVRGYPKKISEDYRGLPSNLNAAFQWTNGKTYFFKGNKYWRFKGFVMDDNFPKYINDGFVGIPDNVDGAFVWSGNGKIYFFKGSHFYKFDPTQRPPVAEKYPKDISLWKGVPYNIDDALNYSNGYTYFFKGGQYWRFDDRSFKVDASDPPYPRPVGSWWFGCSDKGSQAKINNETISIERGSSVHHHDEESSSSDGFHYYMDYDDNDDSMDSGVYPPTTPSSASLMWFILPLILRYICV